VPSVEGWATWQRQTDDGAVESEQRIALERPVVEFTRAGAERLGRAYWPEVRRITGSLVRPRQRGSALELRALGGPVLLRFGEPTVEASDTRAACSYPILGGLLASRAAGEITFEQTAGAMRSTIRGFFPRLAGREGEPDWTGALYNKVQSRAHLAVTRRYFRRLIAEAGR
jgi:hypothetical protein